MCAHKEKIPAVLGMNIIRECYVNLFNEHGTELFQIPQIRSATPAWKQALRCCQKRVGAGTVTMVPVTCPQVSGAVIEFLLELLAPEENALPEGLLLSPSLVYAERGLVYAPIVNVGSTEVWVAPRRIIVLKCQFMSLNRYLVATLTFPLLKDFRNRKWNRREKMLIEESLDALTGARWFSTLDLASGYNQVEEHLLWLEEVFKRLQQEGLKFKMSKCSFFQKQIKYLGHLVSEQGVATDPDKVAAVKEWGRPVHLAELRSFLGFASYYRRFIEGFAKLAKPLHELVTRLSGSAKKGKTLRLPLASVWNAECESSFQTLKAKLVTAPVLTYADFHKPFVVEIDASHQGLGAILSQEQDGKHRPIAYASRGLRRTERNMENYSSMKLECLALKWATSKLGALEQRWLSQLASFNFVIKHRPGRQQLRERPLEQVVVSVSEVAALPGHSQEDLSYLQKADPIIGPVMKAWKAGSVLCSSELAGMDRAVKELSRQWDRLREKDGCLYRVSNTPDGHRETYQLLLPQKLQREVFSSLHDSHGHQGKDRTEELVKRHCYWPGMMRDVERWCRECQRCILAKAAQPKTKGEILKVTLLVSYVSTAYRRVALPRTIHRVVREPGEQGAVYSVVPMSQIGPMKQVHRMEMRKALIDSVSSEVDPIVSDEAASSSSGSATDSDSDAASGVLLQRDYDVPPLTVAEDSASESSAVSETQPLGLLRSGRSTAGQHSNPHRLPR
ncbi:Retrovirus-related Pol polyprotein from transposon opus [Labeo rohita]|uniref:Gypsy retrotransposon integrase-like protein 1 n=1 Tax=Labeo rohita TaxID=84645 RepID=A0ABQ8M4J5_LABRO|nr:Retrovirus-related Pol polyprotein from transposon opus [Labeo rohita]